MARLSIVLLISILAVNTGLSQFTGVVKDSSTGKPVPGATILFTETGDGVAADAEGLFRTGYSGEAIISAVGFKTLQAVITESDSLISFYLDPEDYLLEEVVVEAFNRSRRLIDVPGSLSLIQAGQIERENPVTVVPLLNQAPGVFAHSGALNTSRITIRGIGARVPYATGKVRAYLNNIPLTNGSGVSIVEDIDPSLIERIEIVKGPATSVYGAGLGGTIIITPGKPSLRPAGITNNFQAGSWDLYRNVLSYNSGGDKSGISLQYNHTQSNGYRQNNNYRRDGLSAVSQLSIQDNTDMTVILSYTSLKAHIPSSIDGVTYETSPRSAAQNWLRTRGYEDYDKLLAGISTDHRFSPSLKVNLSLFSTLQDEHEMRPFDVLFEDRFSGGTRFKIVHTGAVPQGSWQLLAGGELFAEKFRYTSYQNIGGVGEQGEVISDNREIIRYYNIFTQADLDLSRLKLSAGINFNSSTTDYIDLHGANHDDPTGKYMYSPIISPRLSANYRYHNNNALFVTLSHGFSPPSLSETLTPEGSINTDIRPETSWSIEGGIRGNLLNQTIFYDINLYNMRVSNLLVAERVGEDAWVGRNAGESLHRGVEAEFQILVYSGKEETGSWWDISELTLSPNLTLNNFRFTDFSDGGIDYSGNKLPGIPAYVLNIGVTGALNGGPYWSFSLRNVGDMAMNDLNSRYTEAYLLANARAGYKAELSGNLVLDSWISAGNIFNTKYPSMILVNAPVFNNLPPRYYYPGNPSNFTAGISLGYRF
jgi:iron complex outermembrane recepter protein